MPVGAVEPQRGCDRIASVDLRDRGACIAASLKLNSSQKSPISDRAFLCPPFSSPPLQFFLSLPPTLDYCGNCPRTLLNCAGMFHTKIKYP